MTIAGMLTTTFALFELLLEYETEEDENETEKQTRDYRRDHHRSHIGGTFGDIAYEYEIVVIIMIS